ncbi:MAG TPA: hypothetical protein VMV92_17095 [Streptosporangiaceae bacterium]|nr:hypothetical protein [Streptosporangiaceae bacterium]
MSMLVTCCSPSLRASRAQPYPDPVPTSRMSAPSRSWACWYMRTTRPGMVEDDVGRPAGWSSGLAWSACRAPTLVTRVRSL